MNWVKRVLRYLENLNNLMVIADCLLIAALTCIIVYGVMMRYVFDSAAIWVTELCLYLIVYVIFLPLAFVQQIGRHVRVDAVTSRLSKRNQTKLSILTSAISLFAFVIFTWSLTIYAHRAFVSNWHGGQPEGLFWPQFPIIVIIPISGFFLSLQLLIGIIRNISVLTKGPQAED
ncbi:TRAP transporter small permease subunit [Chloroflexota bacterium]